MTDNQLTNEQLIELVQQKAPEELTSEQIELLRERLTTSPELRSALLDRLQLETYLTAALGRCEVSLDEVLSQARNQQASAGWLPWTALALCGLFLIGCGILLSRAVFFAPLDRTPRVAEKTPSNPPEVDPSPAMPGEGGETSGPVGENTPPVEPPGEASPEEQTGEENVIVAAGGAGGLSLEIGAEQFTSGSVSVDRAPLGDEEVAFIFTEATPSFVEYEFALPREANCEIRLRYAAFESRPLNLTVNGKVAPATVAGEATGGWMPDSQKWFSAGAFPLKEGKNRLRFVAQPAFPHLSRLLIREPKPVTAVAVAQPVKPPTGGETQVPDGEEPGPNVPAGPWAEGLAGESPAYSLAAFRKFDFSKSVLQEADLKRWFNGVAGAYSRFYQGRVENAPCGGIDGTFRLAAPWPENAVLKFAPADCERLRIHLFHGRQGATLVHYRQHDDRWAGYVSTRNAGEPAPDRLALTSTDDQRNRRTEARFQASYELRWQAGEVVLSRGDVPLLRVPLAEPPEEILFAGKTLLPGLEMYLSEPFPLPAETPAAEPRPASEFVWNEERIGAGAKVERRDDGAITLIGDAAEGRGWLTTPLPNPGLTEVIFELSEVSQGMGVYLGRSPPGGNPKEAGSPDEAVLFTFDRRTGWTCAQWGNIWDQPERDLEPNENAAMAPISAPLWI